MQKIDMSDNVSIVILAISMMLFLGYMFSGSENIIGQDSKGCKYSLIPIPISNRHAGVVYKVSKIEDECKIQTEK